ncbi:FUSC family protein [Paenibacillus senegalensis]|uniref:FUSC family protein n=1 Tax=Paenibacillus senegalensis TaxID=1465766 RepID=UPI00028A1FBA|nr:aromatic acid exporter family protein [Paenibacillus senegalensis]
MELGARVLKTGVAVTLALYLCALLEWTPAIIAAVAAIFTMQPSIYRSWRHIRDQLQTNLLGASLALMAGMVFNNEPIAIGMVCIVVIMICIKLKMESTIGLTLVTVIAVMDVAGDAAVHWTFALNRLLVILLGIGSAFLVNIAFFPPQHEKRFLKQVNDVFNKFSLLMRASLTDMMKEPVFRKQQEELKRSLHKLEDKYTIFEEERQKLNRGKLSRVRLLVVYKEMLETLRKGLALLEVIRRHESSILHRDCPDNRLESQLERLVKQHEWALLRFAGLAIDSKNSSNTEKEWILPGSWDPEDQQFTGRILIAAAMYDYAYHIARLERLVRHNSVKSEKKAVRRFLSAYSKDRR